MMPYCCVYVIVKEVRGFCAISYKPGDMFIVEKFYISNQYKIQKYVYTHYILY